MPDKPGVYKFKDNNGKIIYVGKAKSLKKRVSSYFTKNKFENTKTKLLVAKIRDLEYIVVASEYDALLLENNLIKELKPRYNIQLKDDKSFPWICIKKEDFPRIFSTRNPVKDGSEYYGPYASVKTMRTILGLVKQIYPLRTCNLKLNKEAIEGKKYKLCLEYHIGNCKGPCVDFSQKDDYDQQIDIIRGIIKGKTSQVIKNLKKVMQDFSEKMDYEKAQLLKEKVEILSNYQAKSTIVSTSISNVDVFSIVSDHKTAYINYLHIIDGGIVNSHLMAIKKVLDESDEDLLTTGIAEIRAKYKSEAKEIIVPIIPEINKAGVHIHVPQRGTKKELLTLSERNARYYMLDVQKREKQTNPESTKNRVLETIQKDFRLVELPKHIECFDNSNFQGTNAVAACVVFKNGKPSKKDYRHFNIKTVEGPDDFASMEEVVFRRYKRLLDEEKEMPQLIVIDGGKGQLSAACKSLKKLNLLGEIAIVGIAKKLEEIYFPNDPLPLYLDKRSESLKIIQQLRNEAHRFGINHHRNKRSKTAWNSELENISGLGEKSINRLITTFKSIENIKNSDINQLTIEVGKKKAELIFNYFRTKK